MPNFFLFFFARQCGLFPPIFCVHHFKTVVKQSLIVEQLRTTQSPSSTKSNWDSRTLKYFSLKSEFYKVQLKSSRTLKHCLLLLDATHISTCHVLLLLLTTPMYLAYCKDLVTVTRENSTNLTADASAEDQLQPPLDLVTVSRSENSSNQIAELSAGYSCSIIASWLDCIINELSQPTVLFHNLKTN